MKPSESSTVLGKSVTIRGEITGSEDLYVDGVVHGTITLTESRLTLGPAAQVTAELHVQDLVVLGRLEGTVTASGRVDLRQSATLLGDVTAARLSIEDSAVIRGKVSLTGAAKE